MASKKARARYTISDFANVRFKKWPVQADAVKALDSNPKTLGKLEAGTGVTNSTCAKILRRMEILKVVPPNSDHLIVRLPE